MMSINLNSDACANHAYESGIDRARHAIQTRESAKSRNIVPFRRETLLAEGDSWFDYPGEDVFDFTGSDILNDLEDRYGYDIEDVAHKGDTIEEMAYSGHQLDKLIRKLDKLVRRDEIPKAILLSGGGNDITGETFKRLLNRADSPAPGLNELITDEIINGVVKNSYIHILSTITQVCIEKTGSPIPLITHSYDYAVADGRGFKLWFLTFSGPWLEPGFIAKGYYDMAQRKEIVRELISRFQSMLAGVTQMQSFSHVKHVDATGTLSTGSDYKDWWHNELHPTDQGFELITDKFAVSDLCAPLSPQLHFFKVGKSPCHRLRNAIQLLPVK